MASQLGKRKHVDSPSVIHVAHKQQSELGKRKKMQAFLQHMQDVQEHAMKKSRIHREQKSPKETGKRKYDMTDLQAALHDLSVRPAKERVSPARFDRVRRRFLDDHLDEFAVFYHSLLDDEQTSNEYVRRLAERYKDYYVDAESLKAQLQKRYHADDSVEWMSPYETKHRALKFASGLTDEQYDAALEQEHDKEWNQMKDFVYM